MEEIIIENLDIIIMQIIIVLINCYIATTENKKGIYVITFIQNFFNLLLYLFNNDKATALLYIIISLRSFLYIYKEKLKSVIIPIICIILQLVVGFTAIENVWQLIPILTPCFVCYYMWFSQTTQKLRIWNAVCAGLWGIYNLYSGLYIVMISRIITVIVNVYAYVNYSPLTPKTK